MRRQTVSHSVPGYFERSLSGFHAKRIESTVNAFHDMSLRLFRAFIARSYAAVHAEPRRRAYGKFRLSGSI